MTTLNIGVSSWFNSTNLPYQLEPGEELQAQVVTAGVGCNDSAAFPLIVTVTYQAATAALVTTPASFAFGNIGVGLFSPYLVETITNNGTGTITLTAIGTTDATNFPINLYPTGVAQPCGFTFSLRSGNSCEVAIAFNPQSATTYSGDIVLQNDFGPPVFVPLSGTGIADVPRQAA